MKPVTRLFDFPYHQLAKNNLIDCLVTKYQGQWIKTSTQEFIDQANTISRALLKMGVKKNDKIALISTNNRTEWSVMDIGILQIGAQTIPIYPTITAEEYQYILNHSESIYCFISDQEIFDKIHSIQSQVPTLKEVYSFDKITGCKNWKELLQSGADESNQPAVETCKAEVLPSDLATIIYTSGTTGTPKGVMLTHNNVVSNVIDSTPRIPIAESNSRAMSFLPVCHIFERMLLYLYQYYSVSIYFAESIEKISDNLKEVKPHVMSVVPRLLEKVYDKIYAKGTELSGIKKTMFFWAVNLGLQWEPYGINGWWYEKKLSLARKLIFSKWKEALGGELEIMVSGSAALQPRLTRVFCAAGIPVMEGYGLTETSPVISVNDTRNSMFRIGTVGKPIDNVEVKIANDGEILCKGPNIMMGYYKNPELTAQVMSGDYFHTGDIGEIDADGFLKITDRKKEMFKTSGGKYIAPQLIENALKQSLFIDQVMVIGEGEKMPAAFIQPSFDYVKEWAKRKEIDWGDSLESLCSNQRVITRIQKEVDYYNQKFGQWEKIKRFELTPEVWSIDAGHLTPTMKLKRRSVKEKYLKLYEKIYSHS